MSSTLPPELLDHIANLLHDSENTLKRCCLVSKSWIPRVRKHLFADIKFSRPEDLQSWKTTFPDPSTSPACYTRILLIKCPPVVVSADAEEEGWISTFTRVEHFKVDTRKTDNLDWSPNFLVPFHGFSPTIKSLHLIDAVRVVPSSQVFDLIYSFPLLEDLSVTGFRRYTSIDDSSDEHQAPLQPSIPPAFTGSLKLDLYTGMDFVASRLLSLPGGLHFRKLHLTLRQQEDSLSITALVEKCHLTLESVEVKCELADRLPLRLIDLSKATELKDVVFICEFNPQWITVTLQTITRNHTNLQRVSIAAPDVLYSAYFLGHNSANVLPAVTEAIYRGWSELDLSLARLRESHSARLEIRYGVPFSMDAESARSLMESFLPELTKRGLVELIGRHSWLI